MITAKSEARPERLAIQLGFWSALGIAALFVVYTICFVGILVTAPLFLWTNLDAYVAYTQAHGTFFQHLAELAMLLFGPLYVALINSIHDAARAEHKSLTRLALGFALIFAALSSVNYFVQLGSVRQNVERGQLEGILQFLQANPASAITAVNVLGWSIFMGLSSLLVTPVFSGGRLQTIVRVSFLANGACCLLGAVGYVLGIAVLVFLTLTLGMGGAVLAASISTGVWFRRMQQT